MDLSEKDILRDVTLDGTGYRLVTWDAWTTVHHAGKHWHGPQHPIGYAFFAKGEADPIFTGEDFGCSPLDAIDSDECLRSLLGFLTLREGDTDPDYFASYTERQIAFRDGPDCEYLSLWGMPPDDDEHESMAFVDNDGGSDA